MVIGALDTDSRALATRIALQERGFDLNGWIFSHLPPQEGQAWLDLGCGTGKQTIALATAGAFVTAVDVSRESLDALEAEAGSLMDRIRLVQSDLDALDLPGPYDCALGSYSLYYAKEPEPLFRKLAKATDRLFFCGPAYENNAELRRLIGDDMTPTKPADFMERVAPEICARLFGKVQTFRFDNPIPLSADELLSYWRSHNLYDPAKEGSFTPPAEFTNVKRGIGVLAVR